MVQEEANRANKKIKRKQVDRIAQAVVSHQQVEEEFRVIAETVRNRYREMMRAG